ncbi:hypothetical protein AMTR_s00071p00134870 [Amborella trichopoda]|uniref:Uncharacterized protein n=1 Tax=Amborella trichopoda TaxID=13333 RepID=U5DEV2_AMBTC|nr:hypothetical protein AMTR_s00071p00134870 [Amborella trichopoda]
MSGLPKRLHEEGNRPTFSSKRSLEDIIASPNLNPNLAGRPSQSIGNEYFPSFEHGKDGRAAKIPRLEPRDSDKRSSVIILPYHNMVSSSIDPHMEHPCNFDNRMEARDAKDSRDPKLDNRENRGDTSREPYIEARVESHSVKVEKDLKLESRVDDKDLKLERDVDFKREIKVEKDGGNTHVNWKDSKDQTWKRIPDSDGWRQLTRTSVHNTEETEKEASTVDDGNCTDAQEAVGENKLDWKCEEKFNEKERKRKDEKIHDWGEKDRERDDRRSNIPFGANNVERRETMREERDSDRWERERKDGAKERERPKDKESIKRESIDANDTENSHYEKEIVDGSMKVPDQDNATIEQKRGKESDSRKGDRDLKDKKKDKDLDAEGDRHDKRGRCIDKDSDDGCVDENGTIEREREGFSYGVQQRRRMLRVRGTPQREPRSRFRPRDIEGIFITA